MHARLIAALCFVVSVAYGALYYGFAVLITEPAAGGEFSRAVLSAAYGGAVLTGGAAAIPVGRLADRRGVRGLMALGGALVAGGLLLFSLAQASWQVARRLVASPRAGDRAVLLRARLRRHPAGVRAGASAPARSLCSRSPPASRDRSSRL